MKKLKSSNSVPDPDFQLDLVLPRTNFVLGDRINYEVQISNPHGIPIEFLKITLYQNMLKVHNKRRRGELQRSFKYTVDKVAERWAGPSYNALTWSDFLQIPYRVLPSAKMTATNLSSRPEEVAEVQYFLQIGAIQCESFTLKSDDFPIQISATRLELAPPPSRPTLSPSPDSLSRASAGRERRLRRSTMSLDSSPRHFGGAGPPFEPPRYSSLSLYSIGSSVDQYGSVETLPPNYEDLGYTSMC